MPNAVQIHGMRFGRLVALSPTDERRDGKVVWRTRCDCGNTLDVHVRALRSGNTRSCGCLRTEHIVEVGKANATHGMHGTRTYRCWMQMKMRCGKAYWKDVKICENWQTFEGFFKDMGVCPPRHSLDRYPDNDGDYKPGNVRWATHTQQQHNRRDNVFIEAFGERKTTFAWNEQLGNGLRRDTILARIRRGWSPEKALTEPIDPAWKPPTGR